MIEDVIILDNLGSLGYHISKGLWYQVESLEEGTVYYETCEGPYELVADVDIMV